MPGRVTRARHPAHTSSTIRGVDGAYQLVRQAHRLSTAIAASPVASIPIPEKQGEEFC